MMFTLKKYLFKILNQFNQFNELQIKKMKIHYYS